MNRHFLSKVILQTRSYSCIKGQQKCFTHALGRQLETMTYAERHLMHRWCPVANRRSLKTSPIFQSEFKELPKDRTKKVEVPSLVSWRTVAVTLIVGGAVIGVTLYVRNSYRKKRKLEEKRFAGKAAIGGPFELIDHNGKPCLNTDFLGQWVLIYFGFTHCPDICPDEIEKMVNIADIVEKRKMPRPQTLFITVDAERDSVPVIAAYVKEFSLKLIGLTGSNEQIDKVSRAYRVYYSAGPKTEDDDYIVDHSIIIYALDPAGKFLDFYGQSKTDQEVADSLILDMGKHNVWAKA